MASGLTTYTPNLGLRKPDQLDFYDVDDFNYNADIIDGLTDTSEYFTNGVANEAARLNPGANINGILFDGTKDVYIIKRCRF